MAKLYQPAIARSKDTRLCQANARRPAQRSPLTWGKPARMVCSHRLQQSPIYFGMGKIIRAFSGNEASPDLPFIR